MLARVLPECLEEWSMVEVEVEHGRSILKVPRKLMLTMHSAISPLTARDTMYLYVYEMGSKIHVMTSSDCRLWDTCGKNHRAE